MNDEETFNCLVGAYYGVREMDEYSVKEYVLQTIQEAIENFVKMHPLPMVSYFERCLEIEQTVPLKTKLQDALLVLPKMNVSLELFLLIKKRLQQMKEDI